MSTRVAPDPNSAGGKGDGAELASFSDSEGGGAGKSKGVFSSITGASATIGKAAATAATTVKTTAATSAATVASTAATAAATNASTAAAAAAATAAATNAATVAAAGASAASAAVGSVKSAAQDKAADLGARAKAIVERWVKQQIQDLAARLIEKVPGAVKDALDDEEMPGALSRGKDRLVDAVWPDVRDEILWELSVKLDGRAEDAAEQQPGVDCFRAFFRYHMFPYDKSLWRKMRDPFWVLFQLIPLVPVAAVNPLWFLFTFLVMDRGEEFQLVSFILRFKGYQFITLGLIRSTLGFILFIGCVTAPAEDDQHQCEHHGPGAQDNVWLATGGFVLQVVLAWLAFLLLPCSKQKGRSDLQGVIEVDTAKLEGSHGGHLRYLLLFDLAAFVLCAALVGYTVAMAPGGDAEHWTIEHVVFGAQVLYGFLSFPFFFFTLPLLTRALTHALPTGYDGKGRTRRLAVVRRKRKPNKQAETVSQSKVDELVSEIKALLPFGSSAGAKQ
ncbi:unnamed protein product [Prorocentrum cordatum]|uniref:Uncharacterized protein n=1 Tax=Prorocentrum cordatum TaxID=2364126 RepID=A0ABN9XAM6_9DINO|nr:unnamed protein product [Polarella glacialis]